MKHENLKWNPLNGSLSEIADVIYGRIVTDSTILRVTPAEWNKRLKKEREESERLIAALIRFQMQ